MTKRPRLASTSTAVATPAPAPDTSNATSAPAPSVQLLTVDVGSATRGSITSMSFAAAMARRIGSNSTRSTRAPACWATMAMSWPIGPPPTTTTCSSGCTRARRTSCTATATGSTRAARSRARSSGRATSNSAGTFHDVCIDPGESTPMTSRSWQMCVNPRVQAGQFPQARVGITVTGCPIRQSGTSSPTAAIRPDISCPITAGAFTRASMSPWKMCRSVPQMPV